MNVTENVQLTLKSGENGNSLNKTIYFEKINDFQIIIRLQGMSNFIFISDDDILEDFYLINGDKYKSGYDIFEKNNDLQSWNVDSQFYLYNTDNLDYRLIGSIITLYNPVQKIHIASRSNGDFYKEQNISFVAPKNVQTEFFIIPISIRNSPMIHIIHIYSNRILGIRKDGSVYYSDLGSRKLSEIPSNWNEQQFSVYKANGLYSFYNSFHKKTFRWLQNNNNPDSSYFQNKKIPLDWKEHWFKINFIKSNYISYMIKDVTHYAHNLLENKQEFKFKIISQKESNSNGKYLSIIKENNHQSVVSIDNYKQTILIDDNRNPQNDEPEAVIPVVDKTLPEGPSHYVLDQMKAESKKYETSISNMDKFINIFDTKNNEYLIATLWNPRFKKLWVMRDNGELYGYRTEKLKKM